MKKKKLSLLAALLMIGTLPVLAVAISLTIAAALQMDGSLEENAINRLRVAATGLAQYYSNDLSHGEEIEYEHDYVDLLEDKHIVLTLFKENVRFVTSVKDASGQRDEGTTCSDAVWSTVKSGNEYSTNDIKIGGQDYYAVYLPLYDGDGKVVGIAFAGEPVKFVEEEIISSTVKSVVIAVVLTLIFVGIVAFVSIMMKNSIMKLVNATKTLADGDLNINRDELTSGIEELEVLSEAALLLHSNLTDVITGVLDNVATLDNNMSSVGEGVDTCNTASGDITKAVDELSKGSVDMAENVQETASNMQVIGDNIDEISGLAASADTAVDEVRTESDKAKNKLNQLIEANSKTIEISNDVVNGINESSKAAEKIRVAAEMITSITSQTSLLSLNASIEAARAGEAGRGFAVVASEISNLASQSSASTTEIQNIVNEIIAASEHNIQLADRIKNAIDNEGVVLGEVHDSFEIVDNRIKETSGAVETIASKVTSLDQAKMAVLDQVSNLSAISEENAASCEETNASMEELSATINTIKEQSDDTLEVANMLKEKVSYFKL